MILVNCNIIGLGYIGLPTAAIVCAAGHKVNGVDINKKIINGIRNGDIHINEPQLSELISEAIKSNKLILGYEPVEAKIHFISVPTPLLNSINDNPKPDLSYVMNAAKSIAKIIKKNDLVILESTCPVGTTEKVSKLISEISNLSKNQFHIVYCPERVLPGNIIYEMRHNNRVIGGDSETAKNIATEFFSSFCQGEIVQTNSKTAEIIKLSENAFRDVNIAYSNELSIICDHYDIDVIELVKIANQHPRVNILNPGIGVGGHCIPVDPWFIISELPSDSELIRKARNINIKKTKWVLSKIEEIIANFENQNKRKQQFTYGFLGITFKPNVDDHRESPALWIINQLLSKNFNLLLSDPHVVKNKIDYSLCNTQEVIDKSDLTFILVGHQEYLTYDFQDKNIIDICRLLKYE